MVTGIEATQSMEKIMARWQAQTKGGLCRNEDSGVTDTAGQVTEENERVSLESWAGEDFPHGTSEVQGVVKRGGSVDSERVSVPQTEPCVRRW